MKTITFRFDGIEPLLLHNNQTADPLNIYTRAIKPINKKGASKSDADHLAVSRLDWEAGFYFNSEGAVCIPGQNIEACIADAGKKTKQGKNIKQAVRVEANYIPLDFPDKKIRRTENPKSQDDLPCKSLEPLFTKYLDRRMVKIKKATNVRTRPRFDKWSLTVDISFDEEVINERTLKEIIKTAGKSSGLGDYRERYGKFEPVELK